MMDRVNNVEKVVISNHAKQTLGDRFFMPESQIKKIVKEAKGMIFFDEDYESFIFQVGKTAVCAVIDQETAVITTLYRTTTTRYRKNKNRWRRLN